MAASTRMAAPHPVAAAEALRQGESQPQVVVCRPGVERGGMGDGTCARDHRWTELHVAHSHVTLPVPTHHNTVAGISFRLVDFAE